MFDEYTVEQFGFLNPQDAYVTKTGIRTLDAILGGGFVSSGPFVLHQRLRQVKAQLLINL